MARQKIVLECDEAVMAGVLALVGSQPDVIIQVPQAEQAFKTLKTLTPLDEGFLQHVLMKALEVPGLCLDSELPNALPLVPTVLRGLEFPPDVTPSTVETARRLADLAREDPRFLQNYLDGKPLAPFI